jgi:phosphatidate phosphatase APP1
MQNSSNDKVIQPSQPSLRVRLRRRLFKWFRLANEPVVKVYHGYGNETQLVIFGHVFSLSQLPRKKYRQNIWTNSLALLRSFMVGTYPNIRVRLFWEGELIEAYTASDGFYRFDWSPGKTMLPGLHPIEVQLADPRGDEYPPLATGKGTVIISHVNQYAIVSDIDDTFLVSHSSNLMKRLYVLFTKNAHSRKPFEGVVKHYKALSYAGSVAGEPNPFFYVSSSEWNLYNFIVEFSRNNQLPDGVFLLSQLKNFSKVFKTGANKHATKFMRIARVMEAYPHQRFILLGDDSQMDPVIYAGVVEHFPGRIHCVYLRHVYEKNVTNVKELISKMEAAGVICCHFVHSKEAIEHSCSIGLITEKAKETVLNQA